MTSKFTTTAIVAAATLFVAAAPPAVARDHHHGYRHHGNVGAGIAGFAAGAILGGALAPHRYYGPDYYAYEPPPSYGRGVHWCMRHYRSYNVRTQTYLGYDGYRHHCP